MTDTTDNSNIVKLIGIAVVSFGLNYLLTKYLFKQNDLDAQSLKTQAIIDTRPAKKKKSRRSSQTKQKILNLQNEKWALRVEKYVEGEDPLLDELKLLSHITCEIERVNHLIIDLKLTQCKNIPTPIISSKIKKHKDQPFLSQDAVLQPGSFVMQNCIFKSGQTIQYEKKFLRAGPRAMQYFDPKNVRADIVALGDICPGINTVIRELTLVLKQIYKVPSVTGVKYSFLGYYEEKFVQLNPKMVQTIHHFGGCFLGNSKCQFYPDKIVDSLVKRKVNQLYMIGGYHSLVSAEKIHQEIKKRGQNIAVCVLLKGITKDIPIFDTCFGFESAIEETQKFIEAGFVASSSYTNCVTLLKVPGLSSGFLAMDACRAARNVNICLVPEFAADLYGQKGLIQYIGERVKLKNSCKIVYSEGAYRSVRDLPLQISNKCKNEAEKCSNVDHFTQFLKEQIDKELTQIKLDSHRIISLNSNETIKAAPATSLDTKLCCQVAHASIYGLMLGYTNFASGHLAYRSAMVPISEMLSEHYALCLQAHDQNWQRLLAMTGQPSFINDEEEFLVSMKNI